MITHYRKAIRTNVATKVLSNIIYNSAVVPVYPNRLDPFWDEEIPAIGAYFFDEPVDTKETQPREYYRDLRFAVEIMLGQFASTIDDQADDIAIQVEQKMFADPYLGDPNESVYMIEDSKLVRSTFQFQTKGEVVFASLLMIFQIEYRTWAVNDKSLDDFMREETSIDNNNDANSQTETQTTVRA